jgi:NADH:ubiquinone oxidoreductase subunit 6 (subunit J)
MDASTISFYSFFMAALVAVGAAIVGMLTRRPERALACFALVGAALVVPLLQLGAGMVAAIELLAVLLGLALLLGLVADRRASQHQVSRPRPIAAWLLAGGALLGFVWVLLATGSRQVAETGARLPRGFGESEPLHELLFGRWLVPLELVGLIALVVLVAAVLAVERGAEPG